MPRANSKPFMEQNYPELRRFPHTTSRMWERKDDPRNYDNWWFNFDLSDLTDSEFIIFIGARDYSNTAFKVFKVPSTYLLDNLHKIDKTEKGWINIYLHLETYEDRRNNARLSFKQFAVN